MQLVAPDSLTRPANPDDATLVFELYKQTPDYFRIISIPIPTLEEVKRELEVAKEDKRRYTELILTQDLSSTIPDPKSGQFVVGYLDYKLDYPSVSDATVNLLLILENAQSKGLGRSCVTGLEKRLRGQTKRLLASIYGQNERAKRFWQSLDYHFAIDAKPVLDWYAKAL